MLLSEPLKSLFYMITHYLHETLKIDTFAIMKMILCKLLDGFFHEYVKELTRKMCSVI